jgi:hypothetical protein
LTLALCLPAAGAAQLRPGLRNQAAVADRRDALEAQIVQRLVARAGDAMRLGAPGRRRLAALLENSNAERRGLARQAIAVRRQLAQAVRDPSTSDGDFTRLVRELMRLRAREHELWQQDEKQLETLLTPRQHAQFLLHWARFQDEIRDILARRAGGMEPDSGG